MITEDQWYEQRRKESYAFEVHFQTLQGNIHSEPRIDPHIWQDGNSRLTRWDRVAVILADSPTHVCQLWYQAMRKWNFLQHFDDSQKDYDNHFLLNRVRMLQNDAVYTIEKEDDEERGGKKRVFYPKKLPFMIRPGDVVCLQCAQGSYPYMRADGQGFLRLHIGEGFEGIASVETEIYDIQERLKIR